MLEQISKDIKNALSRAGAGEQIELTTPPNSALGDFAFPCFNLAKEMKKNPAEVAKEIAAKLQEIRTSASSADQPMRLIERVEATGPYVNFYLRADQLAKLVVGEISRQGKKYGRSSIGRGKKVLVEFAHPNTHKAFHIGHLRNITTGESIVRILENVGYRVARANYQGDVGLHIAKCLWGISKLMGEYDEVKNKSLGDKALFLGRAYARGGEAYENDARAHQEIIALNEKIYRRDREILELYQTTREWSLQYFNKIYQRVGSHFDRLYFESETFERGKKIVLEFLKKGIFKESEGAIIFEGEKFGLHNRVFLTSQGLPTYEAKDLALAELQVKEYHPDLILHLVAREQAEYFKVVFKALEFTLPKAKNKEEHLVYGWVSLKEGKMSSRTGQVVLGEWLLDEVKNRIDEVAREHELKDSEAVAEKVAVAAVKYAFLRTGVANDIVFDIKESVNLTGDSGPYLLYIVARIKSIFRKYQKKIGKIVVPTELTSEEKKLILRLGDYPTTAEMAARERNPSKVAHYLLELAQDFNNFYTVCPVLKAEEPLLGFRLHLIKAVEQVMSSGLWLLGIKTVEEM